MLCLYNSERFTVLNNVVLSKVTGEYIPVKIKPKVIEKTTFWPKMVEYDVYDRRKMIGFARVHDADYGCFVKLIQNNKQHEYGKFGELADKLKVQYCLEKGMNDFEIRSYAAMNSHALHYLRGNRFIGKANLKMIERFMEMFDYPDLNSFSYNSIVKYIIEHTPHSERFNTMFLKQIPMYMPKNLIKKYTKALIENPIKFV